MSLLFAGGVFALLFGVSDTPQVALAALPLVPVALRMAAERVYVDADRLQNRRFWRTTELTRSEIERFDVADEWGTRYSRSRLVFVHFRSGRRQRLTATGRNYFKFWSLWPRPDARNEADDICAQLNAWLSTGA